MKPRHFDFINNKINQLLNPVGLVLLDEIHSNHYGIAYGFTSLVSNDYLFPFKNAIKAFDDVGIPYCFRFGGDAESLFLQLPEEMGMVKNKDVFLQDVFNKVRKLAEKADGLIGDKDKDLYSISDVVQLMYAYSFNPDDVKSLLDSKVPLGIIIALLYSGFEAEDIKAFKDVPVAWMLMILKGEA